MTNKNFFWSLGTNQSAQKEKLGFMWLSFSQSPRIWVSQTGELPWSEHCPQDLGLCGLLWRFAFKLLLYPRHEKSANDPSLFRWHPSTLRNSPFVLSRFDVFPVCGASLVSWHFNLIILFANGLYFSVSVCRPPVGLIICPLFPVRRCRANL